MRHLTPSPRCNLSLCRQLQGAATARGLPPAKRARTRRTCRCADDLFVLMLDMARVLSNDELEGLVALEQQSYTEGTAQS